MNYCGSTYVFMAAWLGAAGACFAAPCTPSGAPYNPAWTVLHVKQGDLKAGSAMLGADGARVTVGATLTPVPGGQRAGSQPWYTRVDWQKHNIGPNNAPDTAVVYLDTDGKGRRYLCRIDTRRLTDTYLQRAGAAKAPPPGPADVRTEMRSVLSYDAQQRLASAVTWRWHDEQAVLKREATACFYYNQRNAYLGAAFPDADGCAASAPVHLDQRFVYQSDGKLLRRIDAEKRMPGLDGKPFVTSAARVIIYDEQGEPNAEYVEDDARRHYRRSLAPRDDVSKYRAVILVSSAAAIEPRSLPDGAAPGFWQFYSVPTRVANEQAGINDAQYLLASGERPAISKADREKVWKALQRPGYDLLFDAQGKYLLVPGTPAPVWNACMNHQLVTRAACP